MSGCCAVEVPPADRRFRRVLWVALAVNAAMFAVETVAARASGSMALQADALDFLGDSLNYGISLAVAGAALATRARAALFKGATMAAFGTWVLASTVGRVLAGEPPEAAIMGVTGVAALAANVGVAVMLFRYRAGDSNMRSIWLCTRNDALGNVAVLAAAGGVAASASHWPDLLVAALVATLCLTSAVSVTRQALGELGESRAAGARAT